MTKPLNIVILAAGKGTRMYSSLPKVLHTIGDKTILGHVIDCAKALTPQKLIVVVGFGHELIKTHFANESIIWVNQTEQLGTGHAVKQALTHLDHNADTLILLGDVPLVSHSVCENLLSMVNNGLAILSVHKENPAGYGRIIRQNNAVTAIIEHKDATEDERLITEVNTGIMAVTNAHLNHWISKLNNNNSQGEYYLTDIVSLAVADNNPVVAHSIDDEWAVTGINNKTDLSQIERVYQQRVAQVLLQQGVTLKDPSRIDVRGSLACGRDVEIDVNCVFEGKVVLGDGVNIAANCIIKNAHIEANTHIAAFTHIDDAHIGEDSRVGPYARLRPGTTLKNETHIGNFVELKNTHVDHGSKVNHLSYIGDTSIGKNVNVGAGVITCNYDGVNKFKTTIEDGAFIGSDSQLVAPVTIGKNATIAAGSTITRDAPADALTFCRAKEQKTIVAWKRPVKVKSS